MKSSKATLTTISILFAFLGLIGWAVIADRSASAQTGAFNAVSDFSITQNPNSAWSYGYTSSRGSNDFTLYPNAIVNPEGIQGVETWRNSSIGNDPQVVRFCITMTIFITQRAKTIAVSALHCLSLSAQLSRLVKLPALARRTLRLHSCQF